MSQKSPFPQWTTPTNTTTALKERRPSLTPKFQPKSGIRIWIFGWINPDLVVCRLCLKMWWMHYLVGVSHFAKYGTNRPLVIWEMLTNVPKIPFSAMVNKTKEWSGIHTRIRIITTSRGSSLAHVCQVCSSTSVRQLSCLRNDGTTERSRNLRLVGRGN